MNADVSEKRDSLWRLAAPPTLWAAHFLLSYATAAVFCAKFAKPDESLTPVRVAIFVFSLAALVPIALLGWGGYRRHRLPGGAPHHADDTPEDRHRFLGLATFLLACLSAVAVLFQALTVVFIGSCR